MTKTYTPSDTNETSGDEFDDGDAPSAGNLNPLAEAAFNTAKFAANRVGGYRMVDYDDSVSSSGTGTIGSTSDATYGTDPVTLGTVVVEAGDIVKVSVDTHVAIGLAASTGEIKLYYTVGLNPAVDVTGAVNELATAFSTIRLVRVAGVAHPATAGNLTVYLDMKVAGGQTMIIEQPIACTIEVWRAN